MKQFVLDDDNLYGNNALTDRQTDRQTDSRRRKGLTEKVTWHNGQDVFDWWIEEYKHNVKGQITIDEWLKAESEEV